MPDDQILQIIEKLLPEANPESISLRVKVDQSPLRSMGSASGSATIKQTYIQTADGQRFFEEWIATHHKASYCDGEKCANVKFSRENPERQVSIGIGNDFSFDGRFGYRTAPEPFRFYHVGLKPLPEALPAAERLADTEVIGRPCDVFHFPDVGLPGQEHSLVYALDRETAVPLRIGSYTNPGRIRDELPSWTWEAKTLDRVGDHHYPLSSLYSVYLIRDRGDGEAAELNLTRDIQVEQIAYDAAYPASTFWPTFAPGVQVLDTIERKHYTVPTDEATATTGVTDPARQVAQQGTPIRVDEPGSGLWLGGAGAVVSLAVLAAAFLLARRNR